MMRFVVFLSLIGAATLSSNCARTTAPAGGTGTGNDYYAVSSSSADFFVHGPQQANGADRQLARGTLMTVDKISFGYAQVHLTSGEEGYVARQDIKPAPPAAVAKTRPTARPAAVKYHEPKLPSPESSPAIEPSAIPAPSASP